MFFNSIKVKINIYSFGSNSILIDENSLIYKIAKNSIKNTWRKNPLGIWDGGSIPIIPKFKKILKLDPIMIGFGLKSDDIHSPNERFGIYNFFKGINNIINFYSFFSKNKKL